MDTAATILTDPVAIVDSLEPDDLRERIAGLDRRSRALRVLLRAVVARERARDRSHRQVATGTADARGGLTSGA